jgi:hypothetical protein
MFDGLAPPMTNKRPPDTNWTRTFTTPTAGVVNSTENVAGPAKLTAADDVVPLSEETNLAASESLAPSAVFPNWSWATMLHATSALPGASDGQDNADVEGDTAPPEIWT